MKNSKYFRQAQHKQGFVIPLVIAIIVIVAVGVAYFAWSKNKSYDGANGNPEVAKENVVASTTTISDWKTYTNVKYGFEFKYPTDQSLILSEIKDNNGGSDGVVLSFQDSLKKQEVFRVIGNQTISKNIDEIKLYVGKLIDHPKYQTSIVNIVGKPAVLGEICLQEVCTQIIEIPDFTIQSKSDGQTLSRIYAINLTKSPLSLKILSTLKFTK